MQRRQFIKASLTTAALSVAAKAAPALAEPASPAPGSRDVYELRAYRIKAGASADLLHGYLEHAFLPAVTGRGIEHVGVFTEAGSAGESTVWVLLPHPSADSVVSLNASVNSDPEVQRKAGDYWKVTSKASPAFDRMDSWLLLGFSGMPRLEVPALSQKKAPRIFELRTYDSFNEERALKKIDMFNAGEIPTMRETGLGPVFYGQGLLGRDLPHLTYLLSGSDRASHLENWKRFFAHPVWLKLKADPIYAETVSKVTSRFLVPTGYSLL
jgi:NIPSNAP protein